MSRPGKPGHALRLASLLGCLLGCLLGVTVPIGLRAQEGAAKTRQPAASHAPKIPPPREPELSVASLGGGLQDAQQAILFAPFGKQARIHVQVQGWDGALATLQNRARTHGYQNGADETGGDRWDLVMMENAPLRIACREGLLWSDPLIADPAGTISDGPGPDSTAPDSTGRDCGAGSWQMNLVLAWDKSRVDMVPTWADFWDVAQRPGKRGLRRDPRGTLEIALMADGVAPEDVYRTLASAEGVDRAFRKLDQLKPYVVWWNAPAEAVQIIESGAVLMTSAPNDEVATADLAGHRSFGTQWAQSLGIDVGWAIPRATTADRRALARQLLAYVTDPARQSTLLDAYPAPTRAADPHPAGGAAAAANPAAASNPAMAATPAADNAASLPPAEHPRPTLQMDDDFWVDHLEPLRQRFDAWIASR